MSMYITFVFNIFKIFHYLIELLIANVKIIKKSTDNKPIQNIFL